MKVSVIVPVYNEEKTVDEILKKLFSIALFTQIIVVDDASTDKTPSVLKNIANSRAPFLRKFTQSATRNLIRKNGIPVADEYVDSAQSTTYSCAQKRATIGSEKSGAERLQSFSLTTAHHAKNRGKGAAIRTALKFVTGDLVFIQDADLEYNPQEIKKLLRAFSLSPSPVAVYGSRLMNNPFPKRGYLTTLAGNHAITAFTNLLYATRLTDAYTCYKLIPAKILKNLNLTSHRFEIEAEITAKLALKKVKILEVPITYNPRTYQKGKKIKLRDFFLAVSTLLRYRFQIWPKRATISPIIQF